jgi:hypothetical protein
MENKNSKELYTVVVGADWYGEWAKNFDKALRDLGVPGEIIYTNSLPPSWGGGTATVTHMVEKYKRIIRNFSPKIFNFLKGMRRKSAENKIRKIIDGLDGEKIRPVFIFVWIPPSEELLKYLKKRGAMLILWLGDPSIRDKTWEPKFDYFDHLFIVTQPWIKFLTPKNQARIIFLPHAASDALYHPIGGDVPPKYKSDVTFVGQYVPFYPKVLSTLLGHDLKIYGHGWAAGFEEFPWLKERYFGPLFSEEVNLVYNNTKIVIGTLSPQFYGATPDAVPTATQRVLDVSMAGGFQITEYLPHNAVLFGDAIKMFKSTEELKKLVDLLSGS